MSIGTFGLVGGDQPRVDDHTVASSAPGSASASITFQSDGDMASAPGVTFAFYEWLTNKYTGAGAGYEIKAEQVSGSTPSGPALGQWWPLGSNRQWSVSRSSIGTTEAVFDVEIRRGAFVFEPSKARITLRATVEPA